MTQPPPPDAPPSSFAAAVLAAGGGDGLTVAQARRVRRRLALSRLSLGLERVFACFWPLVSVAVLGFALAVSELWRVLPVWGHAALVVAVVGLLLGLLGWGIWRFRLPRPPKYKPLPKSRFPIAP